MCVVCCYVVCYVVFFFFFKQKTAYEMRISDWSSDVCSSDLDHRDPHFGEDFEQTVVDRLAETQAAVVETQLAEQAARLAIGDRRLGQIGVDRRQIGRASCRERVCQYV